MLLINLLCTPDFGLCVTTPALIVFTRTFAILNWLIEIPCSQLSFVRCLRQLWARHRMHLASFINSYENISATKPFACHTMISLQMSVTWKQNKKTSRPYRDPQIKCSKKKPN